MEVYLPLGRAPQARTKRRGGEERLTHSQFVFVLCSQRGPWHQDDDMTCSWLWFEWGRAVQGHFLLQSHLGPVAWYSTGWLEMVQDTMWDFGHFRLRSYQILTLRFIHSMNRLLSVVTRGMDPLIKKKNQTGRGRPSGFLGITETVTI